MWLLCLAFGLLVIVPTVSPTTGASVADMLRSIVGPRPVAALESGSLAVQDVINRLLSVENGGQRAITLAQTPSAATPLEFQRKSLAASGSSVSNAGGIKRSTMPSLTADVVAAAPKIGWWPLGPLVDGSPAMAQTLLALDPQRPYAGIALVRIDLSKLKLHLMPGFQEPSHAPGIVAAFPNIGLTPMTDQAHLVAGFNGGFKAVNGHYGMMVNGVTLLAPQPGLATLAIYSDGHVALGAWGQDIQPSAQMIAFRQNCPPIIQNGQISPEVYIDNSTLWGSTIGNKEISWRTGVGLTQDGRYLIYAVGNGTTVDTLAQALLQAGAYNAMQLDINHPWAHFVTYQQSSSGFDGLRAISLLTQMENDPKLYLTPHARDYFYLTTQ